MGGGAYKRGTTVVKKIHVTFPTMMTMEKACLFGDYISLVTRCTQFVNTIVILYPATVLCLILKANLLTLKILTIFKSMTNLTCTINRNSIQSCIINLQTHIAIKMFQ